MMNNILCHFTRFIRPEIRHIQVLH